MSLLFFFSKLPPLIFAWFGRIPPLLSDDLGYLRVGESRVLGNDLGLMVLSVEDESFYFKERWFLVS